MRYNRRNRRLYNLINRVKESYLIVVPQRTPFIPNNELYKIPETYLSFCVGFSNKIGYVNQVYLR